MTTLRHAKGIRCTLWIGSLGYGLLTAPIALGQTAPAQPSPYPAQPGQYPAQPGQYPAQPTPYPAQPGQYPAQPAPYAAQPGQYPAQPGQYPAQPGQYPAQPPYPAQPGQYPAQPPYPAQPGQYPAQPAPYPAQPGQYPAQPTPYGAQPAPYGAQPAPYGAQPAPTTTTPSPEAESQRSWMLSAKLGLLMPGSVYIEAADSSFDTDAGFLAIAKIHGFVAQKFSLGGQFLYASSSVEGDADFGLLNFGGVFAAHFGWNAFLISPGATLSYQIIAPEDGDNFKGFSPGGFVEVSFPLTSTLRGAAELGFISQPAGGNDETDLTFGPIFYLAAGVTFGS